MITPVQMLLLKTAQDEILAAATEPERDDAAEYWREAVRHGACDADDERRSLLVIDSACKKWVSS